MKHKPVHGVGSSYVIFNSSGSINTHQVEMTGDLRRRNCSVRIPDLTEDHDDKYFFRIEYTDIKVTFCDSPIKLTVIDSPWIPTIEIHRVDPDDMKEHQSARIACIAENRCARQQVELTWNIKVLSSIIFKESDGSFLANIRNDNFTLSDKHDGFNISCSARYPVKGGFKQAVAIKTLNVSYAPRNTSASFSPSGLVSPGSWVDLSCYSRAKPPPKITWFKNSNQGPIKVSEKEVYGFSATPTEEGDYYCEAINELGSEKSTSICIDISDSPWSPSINVPSDLKEHQSVTVTCSAFTPCPHSPPQLTWNLQQDSLRQTEKNTDGTFTTKIQENITLSDTHDGYNIRCSARYPVIGGNKTAETEVTLSVSSGLDYPTYTRRTQENQTMSTE
ncbi:myelin-associated glycoprotein-like [Poecilia latipinna]|uniref:myelin-associated glycoprotein-like n=1 Tax=Poecilia latipinna TaxID=48699 RepID=UPI00072DF1CC|nr:PREDICTED: myelin-associated glycoprotein-like [Poecilia latipinna]